MISSIAVLPALSSVLLCLAFVAVVLPMKRLPLAIRVLLLAGITLLVLLPLADYPGWYYVRSVFGDSSITALFFYCALVLSQYASWQLYTEQELVLLRRLVLIAALLLYPLALGLSPFDSYRLGYANVWLLAGLLLLALYCWYRHCYFLALTVTAAVLAFSIMLLESANVWDYLLDPALLIILLLTWLRPALVIPAQHKQSMRCSRV